MKEILNTSFQDFNEDRDTSLIIGNNTNIESEASQSEIESNTDTINSESGFSDVNNESASQNDNDIITLEPMNAAENKSEIENDSETNSDTINLDSGISNTNNESDFLSFFENELTPRLKKASALLKKNFNQLMTADKAPRALQTFSNSLKELSFLNDNVKEAYNLLGQFQNKRKRLESVSTSAKKSKLEKKNKSFNNLSEQEKSLYL